MLCQYAGASWGMGRMARINVEEAFWTDVLPLAAKLGDPDRAVGNVLRFWKLAQEKHKAGKLITEAEFEALGFAPELIPTFAVRVEGGIQAKGAEKHFSWLRRRVEAGKRGGSKPKQKKANGSKGKHPEASPSPSFSYSQDKEEKQNKESAIVAQSAPPQSPAVRQSKFSEGTRAKMLAFLNAYADGYKRKYGGNPEGLRQKAVIGKVGHWIEAVSAERAVNLIQVYLQIDYRPINESYHDLWQFFRHLNRIGVFLDSGKDAHGTDWAYVFGGKAG